MLNLNEVDGVRAVFWHGKKLRLLDQRQLPKKEIYLDCESVADVADAIRNLAVRGAPAIGIAAAYGVVIAAQKAEHHNEALNEQSLQSAFELLRQSRPTAVNLFWSLDRMLRVCARSGVTSADFVAEAEAIHREDYAANRRMSELGSALLQDGIGVLTHCNTGSLATSGLGTALGVIRAGVALGKIKKVYAGETRPWNQGARLTMWELVQDGIEALLIADSAAAHLMSTGAVQWVIIGADRIAANGDTANKIGSRQLAIVARYHGVKLMVVAPSTTVDMKTRSGEDIHIELRDEKELFESAGKRTVVKGAKAWNPVFDVVPSELIDAIVTERGVIKFPNRENMREYFGT